MVDMFEKYGNDYLTGHDAEIPPMLYAATGCPQCDNQGYQGRLALTEVFRTDPDVDALIARGATPGELAEAAASKGYRTLSDDGIRRVLEGITTLEEVSRVVDLTDRLA